MDSRVRDSVLGGRDSALRDKSGISSPRFVDRHSSLISLRGSKTSEAVQGEAEAGFFSKTPDFSSQNKRSAVSLEILESQSGFVGDSVLGRQFDKIENFTKETSPTASGVPCFVKGTDRKSANLPQSLQSSHSPTAIPRILEDNRGGFEKSASLSLRADLSAWQSTQAKTQPLESTFDKNAEILKVDSRNNAKNVKTPQNKQAESVFDNRAAESTMYRKKPTPKREKAASQKTHPMVVLFGGSFDPPHLGHLEIIKKLDSSYKRVIIIPAFCNPFKHKPTAPIHTRIAWLRELCAGLKRVEISDFEARANRVVYAIEYVRHYAGKYGGIGLALGSDALESLPSWREASEIVRLARIVPIVRDLACRLESQSGFTEQAETKKVDSSDEAFLSSLRADLSARQSTQTRTHALESTFDNNAQKIQTLQKVDSSDAPIFATANTMDRHAAATTATYNDRKNSPCKKVDSSDKNTDTPKVDSSLWRFDTPLCLKGFPISSTQIRAALACGDFTQVAHWIPPSIASSVQKIYYNTH
ncbi:nicotinate-nicotinamide nucleotide adenylyltransferase [Helicobacter canis]|uniref:Probable nicotinate-nucleotide adenylyltransferase n=1 Tax=Helicobacter canis TaxID=29419 RepID=A0A377J7T1_9HELI|nr:nicotinate-nicotinamide nucleotide adenylyltransferase [Helicobacter canis]STO97853.1 Nicotinate-nucleotide adenylyltransferase [Helicobacter canis]